MTFTSKKEADAYDKMLDIADNLIPFLEQFNAQATDNALSDEQIEAFSFFLASQRDPLAILLKGGALTKESVTKQKQSSTAKKDAELASDAEKQPE